MLINMTCTRICDLLNTCKACFYFTSSNKFDTWDWVYLALSLLISTSISILNEMNQLFWLNVTITAKRSVSWINWINLHLRLFLNNGFWNYLLLVIIGIVLAKLLFDFGWHTSIHLEHWRGFSHVHISSVESWIILVFFFDLLIETFLLGLLFVVSSTILLLSLVLFGRHEN